MTLTTQHFILLVACSTTCAYDSQKGKVLIYGPVFAVTSVTSVGIHQEIGIQSHTVQTIVLSSLRSTLFES